jgi:hypothetical protein
MKTRENNAFVAVVIIAGCYIHRIASEKERGLPRPFPRGPDFRHHQALITILGRFMLTKAVENNPITSRNVT